MEGYNKFVIIIIIIIIKLYIFHNRFLFERSWNILFYKYNYAKYYIFLLPIYIYE
jgi:hypothetical protein